jgi:hypothetical protein
LIAGVDAPGFGSLTTRKGSEESHDYQWLDLVLGRLCSTLIAALGDRL